MMINDSRASWPYNINCSVSLLALIASALVIGLLTLFSHSLTLRQPFQQQITPRQKHGDFPVVILGRSNGLYQYNIIILQH